MGDYVWVDEDRDGRQDDDEPGIKDVVLKLDGPDGKTRSPTSTATKSCRP